MSVTIYTGHVGAGKTYEVVKNVILPALGKGRDVVTNIEGLDPDLVDDFLRGDDLKVVSGKLHLCDTLDPGRPDFFPSKVKGSIAYQPSSFVPLGALVVIDEAPKFWGSDMSIIPAHREFFREHRHITNAEGVACDLVCIAQTLDSLHRALKGLCEFSCDCRKLRALGLDSKYTVVTYEGARRTSRYVMGRQTYSYDKRIFPLYRSFAHAHGKMLTIDKRFSVFSSAWGFWVCFALAFPLIAFSLWHLHSSWSSHAPSAVETPVISNASSVVSSAGVAHPVGPSDVARQVSAPSQWSIAGAASFGGQRFAVLRRPGFPLRYLPLGLCRLSQAQPISCEDSGQVVEPMVAPAPQAHAAPSLGSIARGLVQ